MRLQGAAITDVGRVREGNEDSFLIDDRIGVYAVADGMGGHQAGEVASATALEALRASVASGSDLDAAISLANKSVHERARNEPDLRGMGTTLTAVTTRGRTLLIGHVGDSRAYLLRAGRLQQLTTDHSLVEELVREGRLTAEQATTHPQRSIITRALGIEPAVEVDVIPIELQTGDRLLLCCAGLTTMVSEKNMVAILRREPDPERAATLLVDAANASGGEDNVTAVVLDAVGDPDDPAPIAAPNAPASVDTTPIVTDRADSEHQLAPRPLPARRHIPRGAIGRGVRIALWVLPVIAVLALAVGAVNWYAHRSYYVGVSNGHVAVFRGVKGGLLGFDPKLEHRFSLQASALTEAHRLDVRDGHTFTSRTRADAFVKRLRADTTTTTTTTTTTSTTAPPSSEPPTPVT